MALLRQEPAGVQDERLPRQIGFVQCCRFADRVEIEAVVDTHDPGALQPDAATQIARHALRHGD